MTADPVLRAPVEEWFHLSTLVSVLVSVAVGIFLLLARL